MTKGYIFKAGCALSLGLGLLAYGTQAQTVKKVMMEDFTGAWCGWCPEGAVLLENLSAQNPTNMIAIATHDGDGLEIADGSAVVSGLGVTGFPNGAIDRYRFNGEPDVPVSRSAWTGYFNERKTTTAIASVSFANLSFVQATGKCDVDIKVKFTAAPNAGVPVVVNLYVLEDSIPATGGLAQSNYSSSVQGGASPLTNWFHNHTLRMAVGGTWGYTTAIPATPVVNNEYTQHASFTVPATYVKENVKLVAFVAYNGPVTENKKEVINVEEVRLTSNTTGISEAASASFVGIYPVPARTQDLIKVEYALRKSGQVSLSVYNMLGQKVAQPYASNDVSGVHTIHWRPAEQHLAAGTYILRLDADNASQSMRISIY